MPLNEVNIGFNKYCGPAALSVITGLSTDETAAAVSYVSGNYKVTGVQVPHLITAGKRLGCDFKRVEAAEGRSIFFAASAILSRKSGMYLVVIPGHYVVLESRDGKMFICDNHTKSPIQLSSSARLSQKCEQVYEVTYTPIERPRPRHVLDNLYHAEKLGSQVIITKRVCYSDNSNEVIRILTINDPKPEHLRQIARALMEIAQ